MNNPINNEISTLMNDIETACVEYGLNKDMEQRFIKEYTGMIEQYLKGLKDEINVR